MPTGMAVAASLMSPVFEGIRSDKTPTPSDAGTDTSELLEA